MRSWEQNMRKQISRRVKNRTLTEAKERAISDQVSPNLRPVKKRGEKQRGGPLQQGKHGDL